MTPHPAATGLPGREHPHPAVSEERRADHSQRVEHRGTDPCSRSSAGTCSGQIDRGSQWVLSRPSCLVLVMRVWCQAPTPSPLFAVSVRNASEQLRLYRAVRTSAALADTWTHPAVSNFVVEVLFASFGAPPGLPTAATAGGIAAGGAASGPGAPLSAPAFSAVRRWAVVHQLGGGAATALATAPSNKHMKLIPLGGVAAPLDGAHPLHAVDRTSPPDAASSLAVTGKAFCFLPLPVSTQLPVHVSCCLCG